MSNPLIGRLAPCGIPATWSYVYFMKRERTPVLGMPFMCVFLPFVFLLLPLVYRSAMTIWRAAKGEIPKKIEPMEIFAAGQSDVFGTALISGCIGATVGDCADATYSDQAAGR